MGHLGILDISDMGHKYFFNLITSSCSSLCYPISSPFFHFIHHTPTGRISMNLLSGNSVFFFPTMT